MARYSHREDQRSKLRILIFIYCLLLGFGWADYCSASSRIKDIADFSGVRANQLVGYGLVVGLAGTGDNLRQGAIFTRESLIGMLERLGVNARASNLDSKNVAAVMVTANLPAFARQGAHIDVQISALGDASSLLGGTLLVTPMLGADGEVYAIAQGQVTIGGFRAQGQAETVTRGVPTSGRIANGAIVEREVPFDLAEMTQLKVMLKNPDFTTATRIAEAINARIRQADAKVLDSGTVELKSSKIVPNAQLIAEIEQLPIDPDQPAKVIIDETTGVIVMGEDVRIDKVAIAQGNLTIRITETPRVSQPNPFSETGVTAIVPRTDITIDDSAENKLTVLDSGVSLESLVSGLNALGVGPRDMISILQAIKSAGALRADLVVQ